MYTFVLSAECWTADFITDVEFYTAHVNFIFSLNLIFEISHINTTDLLYFVT